MTEVPTRAAEQAGGDAEPGRLSGEAGRRGPLAYLPVALTGLLLAIVPLVVGDSRYFMTLATTMLIFAAYAVAFNIIFGSTKQLFLCLGALAGLSGYGSAILVGSVGLPLLVTVPVGTVVAAALGALFSWVSVRRQLDVIFVGIVTLAFSLVFQNVLLGQRGLTGGETGLVVGGEPGILGDKIPAYYVFLVVLLASLAVYRWLERSHFGWAFRALHDDELAAELAGIDVTRYKVAAAMIGSAMLGLIGALYAHYEGFISPTTYAFQHVDVRVLVMLAFGGIGSLLGPVVGAAAFMVVDELLRPLSHIRMSVYGVILLVLFLGFRQGFVPAIGSLVQRLRGRGAHREHGG